MSVKFLLWGLGALASGVVAIKGYASYSEKQEKLEAEEREKEARDKEDSIAKAKNDIEAFENLWGVRFRSLLLVDSNIWMNREYDEFFEALESVMKRFKSKIKMSSVQFDEIINLKNLPYGTVKSKLARHALSRIEYFQNIDLIEIIPMGLETKKNAYADPDIIEMLIESLPSNSAMTLVSDDRELRIRANQILKDKQAADFRSVSGADIHETMNIYLSNVETLS